MSSYCSVCHTSLNSKSQWEQHISGEKHRKKALLHGMPAVPSLTPTPLAQPTSKLHTDVLDSSATIELNGAFRCKVCPGFEANGIIPMKAHLSGQKHKKALLQRGISLTVKHSDPPTSNTEPTTSIKPKQSPEEQIKAAWTHEILCGFNYYEKGSDIHRATSPHFTYFSKHVPVPGVLKYLRQEN